ncbi:MAG: ribonuclease HII [Anaerolineaceae bacterium]|jgi:ribonuclease HII
MMAKRFNRAEIPPAPDLKFESDLWKNGLTCVAGLDEAGRGALAGPLYAAAVVLPFKELASLEEQLRGVRDSKQMGIPERDKWAERIKRICSAYAIARVKVEEIDALGIGKAGRLVFERALQALPAVPNHILLDFFHLQGWSGRQTCLVKGDQRSLSIACASVLAKTARDAHMQQLDKQYPHYHWRSNKGYGTTAHVQSIAEHGFSPHHRKSFHLHALDNPMLPF